MLMRKSLLLLTLALGSARTASADDISLWTQQGGPYVDPVVTESSYFGYDACRLGSKNLFAISAGSSKDFEHSCFVNVYDIDDYVSGADEYNCKYKIQPSSQTDDFKFFGSFMAASDNNLVVYATTNKNLFFYHNIESRESDTEAAVDTLTTLSAPKFSVTDSYFAICESNVLTSKVISTPSYFSIYSMNDDGTLGERLFNLTDSTYIGEASSPDSINYVACKIEGDIAVYASKTSGVHVLELVDGSWTDMSASDLAEIAHGNNVSSMFHISTDMIVVGGKDATFVLKKNDEGKWSLKQEMAIPEGQKNFGSSVVVGNGFLFSGSTESSTDDDSFYKGIVYKADADGLYELKAYIQPNYISEGDTVYDKTYRAALIGNKLIVVNQLSAYAGKSAGAFYVYDLTEISGETAVRRISVSSASVVVRNGKICVSTEAAETVVVRNLMGSTEAQAVVEGSWTTGVPRGLHFVTVGSQTTKVLVR